MKAIIGMALILILPWFAVAGIVPIADGTSIQAENNIIIIMQGKTDTGAGAAFGVHPGMRTFHAKVAGTGAVTATVKIQVSNDGTLWIDATVSPHIALSGTTSASDGFAMSAKWGYVRAYVDAISGTSATVTVTMGV